MADSTRPLDAEHIPNYMRDILAIAPELEPGVTVVEIYHDDWCDGFKGGACNCNPDIKMRRIEPKGQRGQKGL
jgi:hypothetical protein